MPFGPFISQEEKDKINGALHQNYGQGKSKPKTKTKESKSVFDWRNNSGAGFLAEWWNNSIKTGKSLLKVHLG